MDHAPGWLTGADDFFLHLLESLSWQSHQRWINGRNVLEPRLSTTIREASEALVDIAEELTRYYERGYVAAWANLYRDGDDGVAWHGDRHRPGSLHEDVALVSVGARRPFRIRSRGGGSSRTWTLSSIPVVGSNLNLIWAYLFVVISDIGGWGYGASTEILGMGDFGMDVGSALAITAFIPVKDAALSALSKGVAR